MKILIIGADGQLGTDLCKVIPKTEQVPLTIKDLDITDKNQTETVIKKYAPRVVINTAAYHRVDDCEDHEAAAFSVNAVGAKNIAQACGATGAVLVHISTDYVFDGTKKKPYVETDAPNPQSVYAVSKLAGEFCVRYLLDQHFIVRSSGLYGTAGSLGKGGGNFAENMIKRAVVQPELKVVTDEVLSPTYTRDLAEKIYELAQTSRYGLYHIVNHDECSWYDFTVEIFKLLKQKIKIIPITASEFKAKARRPKYSVLKNAALKRLGLDDLRPWREALLAYLLEKGHLPPR